MEEHQRGHDDHHDIGELPRSFGFASDSHLILEIDLSSLRSRREHKAWGVSPRVQVQSDSKPATAGESVNLCRPFHGLTLIKFVLPGAYAPGFMLARASHARDRVDLYSTTHADHRCIQFLC